METRGLGLALDLKEMVSNGKPKSSPSKVKFNYEPLIFLSHYTVNAVVWFPVLVCLRSLI